MVASSGEAVSVTREGTGQESVQHPKWHISAADAGSDHMRRFQAHGLDSYTDDVFTPVGVLPPVHAPCLRDDGVGFLGDLKDGT